MVMDETKNGGSANAQPMEMDEVSNLMSDDGSDDNSTTPAAHTRSLLLSPAIVIFFVTGICIVVIAHAGWKAPPVKRNRISHDYSNISIHYNFEAAPMDHWCLFGNDDECECPDFTEPSPRLETPGWLEKHEENKKRVATADPYRQYDVIFVGDEMVERMMNTSGSADLETKKIADLFRRTFKKIGGGTLEGVALGISGDTTSNVIWRMQHGEMPGNLYSGVYWLWVGVNDLITGGCSEEAVLLGILRAAEELSWHDPDAVVVVQGILPFSMHGGTLDGPVSSTKVFHQSSTNAKNNNRYSFWPSIMAINKELEKFCTAHPRMVYFDAGTLFLGSMGSAVDGHRSKVIRHEFMPDFLHPSLQGYKLLFRAMKNEIERITLDDNEKNFVETP